VPPGVFQQTILRILGQINVTLGNLQNKLDEPNVCAAPDFAPVKVACPIGLPGQLQVTVFNQGSAETDPVGTVTRAVFNTPSGPVQEPNPDAVNTQPLLSGGSQIVLFNVPPNCTAGANGGCEGTITVNATNAATPTELIVTNNTVSFSCFFAQ
jgi:hypothetical protein